MSAKKFPLILIVFFVLLGLSGIPASADSTVDQPSSPTIRLKNATFDPLNGGAPVSAFQSADLSDSGENQYIIQFTGPVIEDWKNAVIAQGAKLYAYIPDFAFLARMDSSTAQNIQSLDFVRWVGPYQPDYRMSADLSMDTGQPGEISKVNIETLPDADLNRLAEQIQALGGIIEGQSQNEFAGFLTASIPSENQGQLASLADVVYVEPYFEMQLTNDIGGTGIMRAGEVRQKLGLYGEGQIVGVTDSGLDTGNINSIHPDVAGRIIQGFGLARPGDWSDLDGHGTHVVGSVLGNGVSSGSNPTTHSYNNSYAGVAPEAQLVFQSHSDVNGNLSGIPNDEGDLFRQTYPLGARIHTNSWGGQSGGTRNNPTYGGYIITSFQVDTAAWEMKDMTILFSAGNNGLDTNKDGVIDKDSIGQPGTAKNIITVGATENLRPGINVYWGLITDPRFKINPISSDKKADNSSGMAAFSSRGPTDDGRIKPDVVAPGTFIASLRSSISSGTGSSTMSDAGLAQPGDTIDKRYLLMNGTSMSTPLTAGAAAIVREWLQRFQKIENPSSALIKNILIHGAVDIAPGQYGTGSKQEIPSTSPNMVSGWGRVDLANSLIHAGRKLYFADETNGVSTGETKTLQINVGGSSNNSTILSPVTVESDKPSALPVQSATQEPSSPPAPADQNTITNNPSSFQEIVTPDAPVVTVTDDEVLLPEESAPDLFPTDVSQQLVNNTGFENTSDWVRINGADYTTGNTATGSRSMQINLSGKTGNVGFYQFVHIPEDITSGSLTFSWMNNPYDATNDHLRVCFLKADLATSIGCSAQLSDASTGWRQNTSSLSQILESVRGKRVAIYLYGSSSSGSPSSSFYVDDISLNITRSTTQTTPQPASQQLFNNPGFESTGDWAVNSKANYTTSQVNTGSYSMQITASASGGDNFYQFVDIPDDISSATLSFSWMNNPYDAANDQLQVCILSADFATTIGCTELLSNTDTGWHQYSSSLSAVLESIRGKFVIFYFYTATSGQSPSSQFFVDNANLDVTRASTPTPQPTVQPTPTQNPNSQQVLKNISFEDTSDWVMGSQASYTTTYAHTGSRSVKLTATDASGNANYYQIVDIPSNATSASLNFAWMLDPSLSTSQYLNICVTDVYTNAEITCFNFGTSSTTWEDGNHINFSASGQRVKIKFTATTQSSPVTFFMDDVRVDVTLGTPQPTTQPTVVQPTATAIQPTAVQPTATAVPPTTKQLLNNSSFESTSDWVLNSGAEYSSNYAYTGSRSMKLITHDLSSASYYQIVNIPSNATSAKLTFAYMMDSARNTGETLNLQVCITNVDTGIAITCEHFGVTNSTQWKKDITLNFSASGQRVKINFSASVLSYLIFYMDDVRLDATLGTVQPTAQPTIQPTSVQPTSQPTAIQPTSVYPTSQPTSISPTAQPTAIPTPQTGGPFKVSLVWTDFPGLSSVGKALVNDLDLEVIAPDGTHYYGNSGVYSSGSSCLRDGKWDSCNNVEGVTIPRALYGDYKINVIGYNVPYGENGKQPFALVVSTDSSQSANNYNLYLPVMQK